MKRFLFALSALFLLASCTHRTNPLLEDWNTPYGIPPFDQIEEADFVPALQEGIRQDNADIEAIIANPEAPSFDNVIAALDRSGSLLNKVSGVFSNLAEIIATPSFEDLTGDCLVLLSQHVDEIYLNKDLFEKVKAVYDQRETLGLDREQRSVLEKIYRTFAEGGISLDEEGQARIKDINAELSTLGKRFSSNVVKESLAFKEQFGFPSSEFDYRVSITEDRAERERIVRAFYARGGLGGEYDNHENIRRILQLREEKARLLGWPNPAAHLLSDKMARTPETVDAFLSNVVKYARSSALEEIREMQAMMDRDIAAGKLPKGSKIEAWDIPYYAEKVRQDKYDFDEESLRPYFQLENVRDGVFRHATRLYGLQFEPIPDAPKYDPSVEAFKVSDADGTLLGVLITDYLQRETKGGGAWMQHIRSEYYTPEGQRVAPIVINVCSFPCPDGDTPSLLTPDQVSTVFHEFGHALHGLLSQCRYITVSGANGPVDFVELPSQINENWAFQKEVLKDYAKHYETGEVIPDDLVDKVVAADKFHQGLLTLQLCASSVLDMRWHELASMEGVDIDAFEAQVFTDMGLPAEVLPIHRSCFFNHIFAWEYSAGYYGYLWSGMLDKDAFDLFRERGLYDPATALSFRRNILEKGAGDDAMALYKAFRGAEPDPDAMLRANGLK